MIVNSLIISFQEHLECLEHTAKTTKETVIFIKYMYIFLQVHF